MKIFFAALALLTVVAPDSAFAGPRNCLPQDRLPGKRCADEWAVKSEQDSTANAAAEQTAHKDDGEAGEKSENQ